MPSTGVIITRYKHDDDRFRRALDSVYRNAPDVVMIADDRPSAPIPGGLRARPDAGFLSWLDAAHAIGTDYVAILHDDDWYEPQFIARASSMMTPDVAYVFSQSRIHWPHKPPTLNLADIFGPTGEIDALAIGEILANSTTVISPSCMLYRRADLLRCLLPFGVPGMPSNGIFCGPDLLMCLLPLLSYPRVGWIAEPLVNFDGHAGSTTVSEMAKDGGEQLQVNYNSARLFYKVMSHICSQLREQATV